MPITQERFNELIYWSMQLHVADIIESDDALCLLAKRLFCTRFNSISQHSYQNLYHQFNHHADALVSHYAQRTGAILTNEMRLTLADYNAILTEQKIKFNDDDKTALSFLKLIEIESILKASREYNEQEYRASFNRFKQKIIGRLNDHFKSNFDYTCIGSTQPSMVNHFFNVYRPEIITAAVATTAAYRYNPAALLSQLILTGLIQSNLGMHIGPVLMFGQFATQELPAAPKPEYLFDPHRHVKIGLSNDPRLFLNQQSQSSLINMRVNNPKDIIHFVYAKQLLSPQALTELARFCKKHTITPVCIEDEVMPQLDTVKEKKLAHIFQQKIDALNNDGNLITASDILPWLMPLYSLGTYSDLDVDINTARLPSLKVLRSPLLLNVGSGPSSVPTHEILIYRNDIISIVNPLAASKDIEQVQTMLIDSCQMPTNLKLSGAESVSSALFKKQYSHSELDQNVADYSFSSYQLTNAFQSVNPLKIHATQQELDNPQIQPKLTTTNDASWLKSGQKMSALILQSLFKKRVASIRGDKDTEEEPTNSL